MSKKNDNNKRKQILITFPDNVNMPDGVENVLQSVVGMICKKYENEHEGILMWPSGIGDRLISGMYDDRLKFDESTLHIDVSMREMTEADKYYRGLPSTFVPPPRNNDAVLGVC